MPNGGAERLRKLLAQGHARSRRSGTDARRQALQRLDQARRLFTGKAAGGIELEHVVDGLEATYRKVRKAFRRAYKEPSDETFHAWRKKVQQHWRHMSLLSHGWPEAMSARASEAKELSRLLGEDHDYSVLLAFAGEPGSSRLEPSDLEALAERCRTCQADLRALAKPRGERLFAEQPDDLKERVTLYWTSAGRLAALAPAKEPAAKAKARASQGRPRSSPAHATGGAEQGCAALPTHAMQRRPTLWPESGRLPAVAKCQFSPSRHADCPWAGGAGATKNGSRRRLSEPKCLPRRTPVRYRAPPRPRPCSS